MLRIATPDLYRANAFRILGVLPTASAGELSKQAEKMRMLESSERRRKPPASRHFA